ncbi:indolepyruvate oxidoreductase subunit beta [Patescibacteria group bacterium]|nr:indolepyruvate oxidoreductase subunit beta [Patescibacteria group bacterium]MBU4162318.1 indolepyruvate oxidoreductase subunit beta [Patescibacteria group bacterium]
MKKNNQQFNIVLSGVGGQGLITLGNIIAEAGFLEGNEVKMSELHGLSQRGGSVAVQVRIGKSIFSPLITRGEADLVLAMERSEALKSCCFSSRKRTIFLINDFEIYSPSFGNQKLPALEKIISEIKPFAKEIYSIKASDIVQEHLGLSILAGVFILSGAAHKGLIPLSPANILKAIKENVPTRMELNEKAFYLAKNNFKI